MGAINGTTVTGGFELALACDTMLASSAARFGDTHARVGIAPAWGQANRVVTPDGLLLQARAMALEKAH